MAKIIDIDDHGQPLEDIKFKLKINKDQAEKIMSYNQLMDYRFQDLLEAICPEFLHTNSNQIK